MTKTGDLKVGVDIPDQFISIVCYKCGMVHKYNMSKFAIKCTDCKMNIPIDYIHQRKPDFKEIKPI